MRVFKRTLSKPQTLFIQSILHYYSIYTTSSKVFKGNSSKILLIRILFHKVELRLVHTELLTEVEIIRFEA